MAATQSPRAREKAVTTLCDQFRRASLPDLPKIFEDMAAYIPTYARRFITVVYPTMIDLLREPEKCPAATSKVIDFLYLILESVEPRNPETDPYGVIFSNPDFLKAIFRHTGLNSRGNFDRRVLEIIQGYLLVKEPTKIVALLLESKEIIFPLLQGCAKRNSHHACVLCNQLVVCHPDVKNLLIADIKPLLLKFPPHLLVDLFIASAELKQTMSDEEFETWLSRQREFSLSDVQQVCKFFPAIWDKTFSLQMLLSTTPAEKLTFLNWIHTMGPQDFVLSPEMTADAVDCLMTPKYRSRRTTEDMTDIEAREASARITHRFPRLYVLSFADPKNVSPEGIDRIYSLAVSEDIYVAAAALQVLAIWIAQFAFVPERWPVYQIAAQVDATPSVGLGHLYRVVMHYLAKALPLAEGILRADPGVRFDPKDAVKVTRESWEFPHFTAFVRRVPLFDDSDQDKALNVLGELMDYFSIEAA
jgi:hypothetical protein